MRRKCVGDGRVRDGCRWEERVEVKIFREVRITVTVTHAETCRGIVGAVECSNNQPYNLLDSQNIITHIVIPLQSYCNLNTTFRRLAMSPTCCKVMTNPLPVAYSTPAKWYYIINPTMLERIPWWLVGVWIGTGMNEKRRGLGQRKSSGGGFQRR